MDLATLAAGVLHVPEPAAPPVGFAADELRRYLGRLFGATPAIRASARPGTWLCLAPDGESVPERALSLPAGAEHVVRPTERALALAGVEPRAPVAAVYALLASAGCRWSPDGSAHEHVPGAGEARRDPASITGRPAFVRRAWAADLATWHYSMPERLAERLPADLAFVDWMAKTGATGFLFIRHANDTQWAVPELLPALTERALAAEAGGHALAELLPRDLFAQHPEYFPARAEGTRFDTGNICTASREALAIVRARARRVHETIPGVTDFHLWGLDLLGGGWCACGECRMLAPSDQALRLCNAAAEGLCGGGIMHLAYHD